MCQVTRIFATAAGLTAVTLVIPLEADAQARGQGQVAAAPREQHVIAFSRLERELIVRFFHGNPEWRAKPLPPGIRRNLARGKPIPPGIVKQVLPHDLEVTLPLRPGYVRVITGTDVVLVEVATKVVQDILTDVF